MNYRGGALFALIVGAMFLTRRTEAASLPPIVRVYVAGTPAAVAGSRDAVQDLCARSNVAVVVRDAAGADEALLDTARAAGLAAAYVDLRPGSAPRVVVVDGETREDLERRTFPEGQSLEISIEVVAHVICSAVESSLAARAQPHAPRQSSVLVQGREPPPAWRQRVGLFAATTNLGSGFGAGAGAGLGVTVGRSTLRAGALVAFADYFAVEPATGTAQISLGLVSVRLMPTLEWQASERLTLITALGGGGDWIRVSGAARPLASVASPASSVVDPVAAAMLGVGVRLAGNLAAFLGLGADLALSRHRYVGKTLTSVVPLFEPARVRPNALAGLSFTFGSEKDDRPAPLGVIAP